MLATTHNTQLLTLHWKGWNSELSVSLVLVLGIAVAILLYALTLGSSRLRLLRQSDVELNIKLGGVGSVKIKPNHQVRQLAHKAWIELVTRKAGVEVDRDNDVISDVYNSWYELFKEVRLLARDIPAHKLRDPDTQRLVEVLIKTLNDGLRPHLTRWQAKYRRWYESAVASDKKSVLTPQDIQKKYHEYDDLVKDMLNVNRLLVQYAQELKKLLD